MIEVDLRLALPDFSIDVRFEAGPGITAVFGRSGAGKTLLVDLLAGLERPDEGRIVVEGRVLFDSERGIDLAPEKRHLGYVFQEDRLFPHLSVRANLNYGMRLVPEGERRLHPGDVVDLLGIGHLLGRRPHHLSGGEKQRVAIARALLASPELVLMDEPLANLDTDRRAEILPLVESLRDDLGLPVVYVSHSTDEIIRLADNLVLISDGRVAASGPVERIMSRLDLRPLTGRHDAGAVLPARVRGHLPEDDLTVLDVPGGELRISRLDLPAETALRVRVRARDVTLALTRPRDLTILNCFHGTVVEIGDHTGAQVDVLVDIGCPLWARVARRSVADLDLAPGTEVYALVKSVAIDRYSVGHRGRSETRRGARSRET